MKSSEAGRPALELRGAPQRSSCAEAPDEAQGIRAVESDAVERKEGTQ